MRNNDSKTKVQSYSKLSIFTEKRSVYYNNTEISYINIM
jgi:hypothetical protein